LGKGVAYSQPPFLWDKIMINKLSLLVASLGVYAFVSIAYFQGADLYYEGYVALVEIGTLFLSGVIVGLLISLVILKVVD